MIFKKNIIVKEIYLAILSILFIGLYRVIDYRLNLKSGFSSIYFIVYILICITIFFRLFNGGLNKYTDLKGIYFAWKLMIFFMIFEMVYSLAEGVIGENIILAIKNLIMPMFIFGIGLYSIKYLRKFNMNIVFKLINIISIINIVLVILGFILGWNTMTQYVLGVPKYAFYAYKFGNSSTLTRVPGFFSDALTQGSFSFLVFIINFIRIKESAENKPRRIIFSIIGVVGIIISTNRQVILAWGIVVCIYILRQLKNKYLKMGMVLFILVLIGFTVLNLLGATSGALSMQSFFMRLNVWNNIFNTMHMGTHIEHLFLGTGVSATTLNKNGMGIALVDNSYILMFHDYGLVGIGIFIAFIKSIYNYLKRDYEKSVYAKIGYYYIIYFIVRMFFQSSIVNTYESNIFFLIELIMIASIQTKKIWGNESGR